MALSADPGSLDPQSSSASALFTMSQFAYDPLVSVNGKTGAIQPQLATQWNVSGKTVTLTLAQGITCSDGSTLTASDVASNLAYVAEPKNKSPFLGTFLPVGATAKGDDASGTVTLTLASPAPFVLNGLASLPIVCPKGMADRSSLAAGTDGTGPYKLTQASPGSQYTYVIRKGYAWGPNGATTATKGLPAQIERGEGHLERDNGGQPADFGRPECGADPRPGHHPAGAREPVRREDARPDRGAVVQPRRRPCDQRPEGPDGAHAGSRPTVSAAEGALTSDKGSRRHGHPDGRPTSRPVACTGDSVSGNVPAFDVNAAKSDLDAAGCDDRAPTAAAPERKNLSLTFLYDNSAGSTVRQRRGRARGEISRWQAAEGVNVTAKGEERHRSVSRRHSSAPATGTSPGSRST